MNIFFSSWTPMFAFCLCVCVCAWQKYGAYLISCCFHLCTYAWKFSDFTTVMCITGLSYFCTCTTSHTKKQQKEQSSLNENNTFCNEINNSCRGRSHYYRLWRFYNHWKILHTGSCSYQMKISFKVIYIRFALDDKTNYCS